MLTKAEQALGRGADLVELRIDFLEEVDLPKLLEEDIPLILTNRPPSEGGRFKGDEASRVKLLLEGVSLGAPCVDLELSTDPDLVREVRERAERAGAGLILSWHDFGQTPPLERMLEVAKRMGSAGCTIGKIVPTAHSPRDVLTILDLLLEAPSQAKIQVVAFAMGEKGKFSRILAAAFGSPLVYAAAGDPLAPGQFNIETTKRLLEELGLR